MDNLSQRDPRWSSIQLGTCKGETIGKSGCFITSLAMLSGKTPPEVNSLLVSKGGFVNGCLLVEAPACSALGLEYAGKSSSAKFFPCVGETDHYKNAGVPQHFFVMLSETEIIDSLDGKRKTNPYHIVSYRNIRKPGDTMSENDQVVKMIRESLKVNEFRIDGKATVYQVFNIPDTHWFEDILGNKWENVRVIPADWPLDPKDWANERNKYLGDLNSSKKDVTSLRAQVSDLTASLHSKQLELDAEQDGFDSLTTEHELTKKKLESSTKALRETTDDNNSLKNQVVELSKQLTDAKLELSKAQETSYQEPVFVEPKVEQPSILQNIIDYITNIWRKK